MENQNALKSLYGDGHVRATQRTQVREALVMQGIRNQRVLTPQCVVDGLRAFWPEGVAFDPCGAPGSLVGAAASTELDGLRVDWPHRTFANPPYGASLADPRTEAPLFAREVELRAAAKAAEIERAKAEDRKPRSVTPKWPEGLPVKKAGLWTWLEHSVERSLGETIVLAPARSHRKWFREWKRRLAAVIELDPLKFHGHAKAFPAPLVLGLVIGRPMIYRCAIDLVFGPKAPTLRQRVEAFEQSFAHLCDLA